MESGSLVVRCGVFDTLRFENADSSVSPPDFVKAFGAGARGLHPATKAFMWPIGLALAAARLSVAVNKGSQELSGRADLGLPQHSPPPLLVMGR